MRIRSKNGLLFLLVLLLAAAPFLWHGAGGFTGADDRAGEAIAGLRPDYQPWFRPLWEPPGREVETFLFASQAAIGGGLVGYYLGYVKGKRGRQEKKSDV